MSIKLKNILLEILHNNSFTQKLNEYELGNASEDNDGNWEEIFNDMKPQDITINELFGWWLEVYSAMASKLLGYSKQINLGHKLNKFDADIRKIISSTKTCMDKIAILAPGVFAKMKKDEAFLLNDIKDDLIEELKELLNKQSMQQESSDIAEKLERIADNYQRVSEELLQLSWDYVEDEDERGSGDFRNIETEKKLTPDDLKAMNYRIQPIQKPTRWITTVLGKDRFDDAGHEKRQLEMVNKLKQGKTLIEIYNWLMNTQSYSHGRIAYSHISDLFYGRYYETDNPPLVPFDTLMKFHTAVGKLNNY